MLWIFTVCEKHVVDDWTYMSCISKYKLMDVFVQVCQAMWRWELNNSYLLQVFSILFLRQGFSSFCELVYSYKLIGQQSQGSFRLSFPSIGITDAHVPYLSTEDLLAYASSTLLSEIHAYPPQCCHYLLTMPFTYFFTSWVLWNNRL